MSLLTITLTLFLIFDSIGHINPYLHLVRELDESRQRRIIIREMLIALLLLIFFYFFGELLLAILDIKSATTQLSGGLVLFLIAIRMIFPGNPPVEEKSLEKEEPFIVPIATPMIAGPSALISVMIYANTELSIVTVLLAIFIAWAASALILLLSNPIKRTLGNKTLLATERLMGLILTMMAVEMLLRGVQLFMQTPMQ